MATLTSYFRPSRTRRVLRESKKAITHPKSTMTGHPVLSVLGGLLLVGVIAAAISLYPEYRRYVKVRGM